MSGGTWILQDKIRPGAYVNFSSEASWNQASAGYGVVAMALEMSWGPEREVMEIYATDMINGNAETLIGYAVDHEKALAFSECLSNCRKVLAYRVNGNGYKAKADLGALTVNAKYTGKRGNDIAISVVANEEDFIVTTYVDGKEIERQKVESDSLPLDNDWVDFSAKDKLTATAATSLYGGTDGSASTVNYGEYFQLMKNKEWQIMALPSADIALPPLLKSYIYDLRENCGKKVQGVVFNYPADYEGIITVDQGYVHHGLTVTPSLFVAWVAGASAGAEIYESNTYKVIDGAANIVNELPIDAIEGKLNKGYFVISRRTDGTIVVEQDVNSLVSTADKKNKVFCKNRVLRTLDSIANGVTNMFETNYIGVINNNAGGRDLFKQDIITFLNDLMSVGAIEEFGGAEDVNVGEGLNPESVVVNLAICPVDAMEKLYMTVEVTA